MCIWKKWGSDEIIQQHRRTGKVHLLRAWQLLAAVRSAQGNSSSCSSANARRIDQGNCLFTCLASVLPNSRSHRQVRTEVADFYASATDAQLDTIRDIHASTDILRDRQHHIGQLGVWGEGVDISAFASINQLVIQAVILTLITSKQTEMIRFFPVDPSGLQDRNADIAQTVLYYNGRDHWSILQLVFFRLYYNFSLVLTKFVEFSFVLLFRCKSSISSLINNIRTYFGEWFLRPSYLMKLKFSGVSKNFMNNNLK